LPAAPEAGGPRNFRANGPVLLMEKPATSGTVLGTYPPGTVFDNLGCERVHTLVWCEVQPLGGGPRGYVSAGVLGPAVSPDGSVQAGADDSPLRAARGDFDARGSIPCVTALDQPSTACAFGVARAVAAWSTQPWSFWSCIRQDSGSCSRQPFPSSRDDSNMRVASWMAVDGEDLSAHQRR
jgi:hypothetical protein